MIFVRFLKHNFKGECLFYLCDIPLIHLWMCNVLINKFFCKYIFKVFTLFWNRMSDQIILFLPQGNLKQDWHKRVCCWFIKQGTYQGEKLEIHLWNKSDETTFVICHWFCAAVDTVNNGSILIFASPRRE